MENDTRITLPDGSDEDFDVAVYYMDPDLCEEMHTAEQWDLRASPEQDFLDAYCAAHAARYGTAFALP